MKILMVTDFYLPFLGGVELLVSALAGNLVQRGHEVWVATLGAPGLAPTETIDGVVVHRLASTVQRVPALFATQERPWAPPGPDPEATVALWAIIRDFQPDVVHGHDWLARSYLPLKRRSRAPFLMSLHYFTLSCPKKNLMHHGSPCDGPQLAKCLACAGRHYGRAKGAAITVAHLAFARAEAALVDRFLPVSQATADGNGLTDRQLPYTVIPNFVGTTAEAEAGHEELLGSLPDDPFFLFVGDVRTDKGADVLLHAYSRLASPPPLALIGQVWPDTPQSLPAGALLLGEWPHEAVRAAMRRCLALVAPSVWPEPFGLVVAEAITAGRPVIASAIGGIPEIVRSEVEGLLVSPGDIGALSDALARMASSPEVRERLAVNASVRAEEFSPATVVPKFEGVYVQALSTAGN